MKNKLQEIREKHGMSREQLAKYLGMSVPNLFYIETNARELGKKYFKKITELFDCSIGQLFGEELVTQGETNLVKIKYYSNLNSSTDFNDNNNYTYEFVPEKLFKMLKISDYNNLIIFNMFDKNMEPIISYDDFVIVDLNKTKSLNNKIYLVKEDGEIKLKKILRTSPFDETITILSENQIEGEYPPYDTTINQIEEFIIGQVVFYGRSIL